MMADAEEGRVKSDGVKSRPSSPKPDILPEGQVLGGKQKTCPKCGARVGGRIAKMTTGFYRLLDKLKSPPREAGVNPPAPKHLRPEPTPAPPRPLELQRRIE